MSTLALDDQIIRIPDGMLVTNVEADLSCQPDGTFVSSESLRTERVRLVAGVEEGLPGTETGSMFLGGSPLCRPVIPISRGDALFHGSSILCSSMGTVTTLAPLRSLRRNVQFGSNSRKGTFTVGKSLTRMIRSPKPCGV